MKAFLIPWYEFLEALKKQHPVSLEGWLGRWYFTDEGVILAEARQPKLKPVRHSPRGLVV